MCELPIQKAMTVPIICLVHYSKRTENHSEGYMVTRNYCISLKERYVVQVVYNRDALNGQVGADKCGMWSGRKNWATE